MSEMAPDVNNCRNWQRSYVYAAGQLIATYDPKGVRHHYKDIPKSVADVTAAPFRSLAGELRRAGGFAKDTTPFSEFLWADFFRRRLSRKHVAGDFEKAMEKALNLARGNEAVYLPGWCGPVPD